jgi:hypothetical protein
MSSSKYCSRAPPLDVCDRRAVREYHARLEAACESALRNGLVRGLCFTFDLAIPPASHLPGARRLPPFARGAAAPSPTRFRLEKPLQAGRQKMSQVWTAVTVADLPGGV